MKKYQLLSIILGLACAFSPFSVKAAEPVSGQTTGSTTTAPPTGPGTFAPVSGWHRPLETVTCSLLAVDPNPMPEHHTWSSGIVHAPFAVERYGETINFAFRVLISPKGPTLPFANVSFLDDPDAEGRAMPVVVDDEPKATQTGCFRPTQLVYAYVPGELVIMMTVREAETEGFCDTEEAWDDRIRIVVNVRTRPSGREGEVTNRFCTFLVNHPTLQMRQWAPKN